MNLAEHRKALGLSIGGLAKLAGVHNDVIHEAEAYKSKGIAEPKAQKICAALSQEWERPITFKDIDGLKVIQL